MIDDLLVIDGHVHAFQDKQTALKIIKAFNKIYEIEFKNSGTSDSEDVLKSMKNSFVDFTVLANFANSKHVKSNNDWTLELCSQEKCLIPLVSFHPDMEDNLEALFETYIEKGARGIKFHPMAQGFYPDNSRLYGLYQMCSEYQMPVVFHCGRVSNSRLNEYSDFEVILPILDKYPKMPVVLTHMVDGNSEDVYRAAENYENVFFDTSIVITGSPDLIKKNKPSWLEDDLVLEVIDRVGAEKLLFGSDYPWGSVYCDLERFKKMNIPKEQLKLILGENSKKLYRIEY